MPLEDTFLMLTVYFFLFPFLFPHSESPVKDWSRLLTAIYTPQEEVLLSFDRANFSGCFNQIQFS